MRKWCFILLGIWMLCLPAIAAETEDYQYVLQEDGTLILTGYLGKEAELVIPARIGDHEVTAIRTLAFAENKTLTSLTLPDTLRSVDPYAFYNCKKLRTITLPTGYQCVKRGAFAGCTGLKEAFLSDGQMYVEGYMEQYEHYSSAANTLQSGSDRFIAEGRYIYFGSYSSIYKMDLQTGKASTIAHDTRGTKYGNLSQLMLGGDGYLYYLTGDLAGGPQNKIARLRISGSGHQTLFAKGDPSSIQVYGGYVYFLDSKDHLIKDSNFVDEGEFCLYRMKSGGGKPELLEEHMMEQEYAISRDGYLYYFQCAPVENAIIADAITGIYRKSLKVPWNQAVREEIVPAGGPYLSLYRERWTGQLCLENDTLYVTSKYMYPGFCTFMRVDLLPMALGKTPIIEDYARLILNIDWMAENLRPIGGSPKVISLPETEFSCAFSKTALYLTLAGTDKRDIQDMAYLYRIDPRLPAEDRVSFVCTMPHGGRSMFLVNGMFLIEKASFVAGPDSFNAVSTLTGLTGNSLELLYNDYQERSAAMKSTMKDLACPLEPNDMEELKLKAAAVTAEKPLKLRSGRSERASTLLTANNGDVFPCLCVMEDGWFALLLENGKIAYAPPGQAVLR